LSGVRLVPFTIGSGSFRDRSHSALLPADWAAEFSALTGDDGSFHIRGLPARGTAALDCTSPAHGHFRILVNLDGETIVRLRPAGRIQGRVTSMTPEALNQCRLWVRREDDPDDQQAATFQLVHAGYYRPKSDGQLAIDNLPPGRYVIWPDLPRDGRDYARRIARLEVPPGRESKEVVIDVQKGLSVRGRFVDHLTGQPVAGVELGLNRFEADNSLVEMRSLTTDSEGRFSTWLPPGRMTVGIRNVPRDYVRPAFVNPADLPVLEKDTELADFRLHRAIQLEVLVVDGAGQPVPDAAVHVERPAHQFPNPSLSIDDQGRVIVYKLDPAQAARLRARSATGTTDGHGDVPLGEVEQPLKLVVSDQAAFRIRGRLVDRTGRPVEGARVNLRWHRRVEGGGIGSPLEPLSTDADGSFTTEPLWPNDRYQVQITATGFQAYSAAEISAVRGVTRDLGTIVLDRTDRTLAGEVVDQQGQPVPRARVFNKGDGPQVVSTESDRRGRYRLQGISEGGLFVFASADGFRFGGARISDDGDEARIVLSRPDETAVEAGPAPEEAFEEDLRAARELVVRLWSRRAAEWDNLRASRGADDEAKTPIERIFRLAVRINRKQAEEWAQAGPEASRAWHREIALLLGPTDLEGALVHVRELRPTTACVVLRQLAEERPKDDQAGLDRLVEESAAAAQKAEIPYAVLSLVQTASMARMAGYQEEARKLSDLAIQKSDAIGLDDTDVSARVMAARELAAFDVRQALALVDPIQHSVTRLTARADVIARRGIVDLGESRRLLEEIGRELPRVANRARLQLAWDLAPSDLDGALELVGEFDVEPSLHPQAEGHAWLAVAIAPRDRARAWTLIDAAMNLYSVHTDNSGYWNNYGGQSAMAARMVGQAAEVQYPDVRSLVYRAVALRPSVDARVNPLESIRGSVTTALHLACVDRETALQLLKSVEPRSELIGRGGYNTIPRREWVMAWMLVDRSRGVKMAHEWLDQIPSDREGNLRFLEVLDAIELLATPSGERSLHVARCIGPFWRPGHKRFP
jgi:protocatechuate 3,4-dioxygenase beta subunit